MNPEGAATSHPSNLKQLKQFAHEEWVKLSVENCRSVTDSNRNSLIAVIASKGYTTQY